MCIIILYALSLSPLSIESKSTVVEPNKIDNTEKRTNNVAKTVNTVTVFLLFKYFGVEDFCKILITFVPTVVWLIME